MKFLGRMCNIKKKTKKQEFTLSLENRVFKKTPSGVCWRSNILLALPAFLGLSA